MTSYRLQGAEETQAEDTILTPNPSLRSGEGSKDSRLLRRLFISIKQNVANHNLHDAGEAGVVSDPAVRRCDEIRPRPMSRLARFWLRWQLVSCWMMERIGRWFRGQDDKPFRVKSYKLRVDDGIRTLRGLPEPEQPHP